MNRKLFFNIVFFAVGTFVVLSVVIVIVLNFLKDNRIFVTPAANVVQDTQAKVQQNSTKAQDSTTAEKEKTVQYRRDPNDVVDTRNIGEEFPVKEKIKVEVVNYSGIKKLAEEVRSTLEINGFTVSAGNASTKKVVKTEIIERNNKKAGAEVQKVLKFGRVIKQLDLKSRFDVTVIIGDDYKP